MTFAVFVGGLAALDSRWSEYKNPIDHISHMVSYGARLNQPVGHRRHLPQGGQPAVAVARQRLPDPVPAHRRQRQRRRQPRHAGREDRLPRGDERAAGRARCRSPCCSRGWFAWKRRDGPSMWALTWAAANWLPYALLGVISNRIMYIYYFLPVVPAVAVAIVGAAAALEAAALRPVGVPRAVRGRRSSPTSRSASSPTDAPRTPRTQQTTRRANPPGRSCGSR